MRQKKSGAEPGNGETLQTCEFQHLHIRKDTAETQRTGPYICTYHCACVDENVHPHHTYTHLLNTNDVCDTVILSDLMLYTV